MKIYENLDINDLDGEVYKVIKDFTDYQVSNFGRIKSFKYNKINGEILRQHKGGHGYFYIYLCKNGKDTPKLIHRLVFESHNNYKLKSNEDVHHIDFNPENNNIDNLIMIPDYEHKSFHKKGERHPNFGIHLSEETRKKMSENHANFKGENHPKHKLTEEQIIQIKLLLREGILTQQEIADMFGVSRPTISAIKTGRTWKYIK